VSFANVIGARAFPFPPDMMRSDLDVFACNSTPFSTFYNQIIQKEAIEDYPFDQRFGFLSIIEKSFA
jgi:hypothetical protein